MSTGDTKRRARSLSLVSGLEDLMKNQLGILSGLRRPQTAISGQGDPMETGKREPLFIIGDGGSDNKKYKLNFHSKGTGLGFIEEEQEAEESDSSDDSKSDADSIGVEKTWREKPKLTKKDSKSYTDLSNIDSPKLGLGGEGVVRIEKLTKRTQRRCTFAGIGDIALKTRLQDIDNRKISFGTSVTNGPEGRLFTAHFFNTISLKRSFRHVTHVSHVYKGTILVTDLIRGTIALVARSGRVVKEIAAKPGSEPSCACITPRGHIAATLRRLSCVMVWSASGEVVREFGHDVLASPTGLACDGNGSFIVTDESSNKIAFFGPTGDFRGYLGQGGSPLGMKTGDTGGVDGGVSHSNTTGSHGHNDNEKDTKDKNNNSNNTVHDNNNKNNSYRNTKTKLCRAVKAKATNRPYEFSSPRYLCLTASGKIVVSDSGSHSVKVFSPQGDYLRSIGSYGSLDGQLKVPYDVCCDQQENIYVADHYNDRVSVFSIDGTFLQHALTAASGLVRPKSIAVRPVHVRKLYVAHGALRATDVLAYRLKTETHEVSFKCDL